MISLRLYNQLCNIFAQVMSKEIALAIGENKTVISLSIHFLG